MPKKLNNQELITILKEVLAAMEIRDSDFFRVRAYQNAISAIENSTFSVYDLWEKGRVQEIPGVGPALTQHIGDLFEKGAVGEFERLKKDLPDGMFALIGIQGIGAKKAYKLANAFDLTSRDNALEKVAIFAEKGLIRDLPGFGEKSEKLILDAISEAKKTKKEKPRILWARADEVVQRIYKYMEACDKVEKIEALGSYRRKKETVGDLDIATSTGSENEVMAHFLKFPEIKEVLVQGDKKASVVLGNDLQVDFRTILPNQYGSMAQYFTGSKYHNISLRTHALEKGLSVSEYGIKKGDKLYEFTDETDFYGFLGLPYIPPEIRQGKEEVALAADDKLPKLVEPSDIKGDLHAHTIFSDGGNTLEEMVRGAEERGYSYIGITDHAPSIVSRGREEIKKIVQDTKLKIDELNEENPAIKVLYGYEVNILADATIGFPDELMEKLDFVIAGIHTSFNQDRKTVMKRLFSAVRHPLVTIIAHPSARLLGVREPLDIDWMVFFEEVKKYHKILEINSQPERLDLPYDLVKEAKKSGIKFIISSDAHSVDSLDYMRFGVSVARRGWCASSDIINTLPTKDFLRVLCK